MTDDKAVARLHREYRWARSAVDNPYASPDDRERAARYISWYESPRGPATVEDLADRIRTALADALQHQERGGFTASGPGLADERGEVRLSLEQVARIAAQEAAGLSDSGTP